MSYSVTFAQSPADDGTIVATHDYNSDTTPPPAVGGSGFTSSVALTSDAANGTGLGVEFYYDANEFQDDTIFLHTFTSVALGDYIIQYDINNVDGSWFSFDALIYEGSNVETNKKQQTVQKITANTFEQRYTAQLTTTSTNDITFAMYMSPWYSGLTNSTVYIDNIKLIKMNSPLTTLSGTVEQTENYDAATSPPPSAGHTTFTNAVELTSAADVNGTGLGVEFDYTFGLYQEQVNSVDLVTFTNVPGGTYYIQYQFDDGNTSTLFDFTYYNQISDGTNTLTNYIVSPTTTGFATHRTYEISITTTSDISLKWIGSEKDNNVQNGTPIFVDNVELIKTAALPVQLVDFQANQEDKSIMLHWTTESEVNNAGFEVQRSTDGVHFESLDFVEGNINSLSKIHYEFRDVEIYNDTRYYYRLKQLDLDGRMEYSGIVSAEYKGKSVDGIKIFPNPADNYINLVLDTKDKSTISIQLFSALGEQVRTSSDILYPDSNFIQLDLSGLAKGVYFLRIKGDNYDKTERILVE